MTTTNSISRDQQNKPSKYQQIYDVVRKIPTGKVLTYGQVAELAGLYGKARLAGYASYSEARCGGDYLQKTLLQQEGIEFKKNNCIDLKKYRWQPPLDLMDE
jgi:methylated-DNA-protein-cysteine methyltransferase related protein